MATLASFFGWRKPSKKELQNTITLSWGKQHYDVSFKRQNLDHVTLKDLKLQCKQLTGVPVASMKLTVSGANLKDDTASLASCGIQGGSTVILTGEKVNKQAAAQETASGNPEEYALIQRIVKLLDPIKANMDADIKAFNTLVQEKKNQEEPLSAADKKILYEKAVFLSEKLMQALITLDGVECSPEFQTARQRRREGVRLLQAFLERVDAARAEAKPLLHA
ncbi:hypothetical protein O0I10_002686 [Lichtheimia ornata]|uniref:BAG family molecular chaperone regulator 1 n=1 Tax=Lichtheimia ornata TaxID=688661 RepID=A0AAD7V9J8_9FUNG|nr:uncharacterized protein O0I10_002686 [Lichtheimia ornata]KAJ8661420.1 hypothetical protein O0I10_002686 [Lichtheimia ornata]